MKFEDAVNNKKCLYAVSDDASDFCGCDRMPENPNYCAAHQAIVYKPNSRKPKGGAAILSQWPLRRREHSND